MELVFAAFILTLVLAMYSYTSPYSLLLQAGERGRFSELLLFAARLASSPDFLFRLQSDWDGAVAQANREVMSIDAMASVEVTLPSGGVCPTVVAPRFSISLASVLPNGTTICIVVRA